MKACRIVAVFGGLLVCIGLLVAASPEFLIQFADTFLTPTGLWVAVTVRIGIGITLWLAAAASRTPRVFRVLGILFIISGLALPALGLDQLHQLADWGAMRPETMLRAIGVIVAGVGALLTWSAASKKGSA